MGFGEIGLIVSTHSRPKAADGSPVSLVRAILFQHTAARRRLVGTNLIR